MVNARLLAGTCDSSTYPSTSAQRNQIHESHPHRRRRTGAAGPYCPKKNYTMPESVSVVQTHSNRRKTKTLTMLTSNETVIIPKIVTWNLAYPIYFDWRPSQKSQKIIKETVNSLRTKSSRKILKRLFSEPLQKVFSWFSFALILLPLFCWWK